DSFVWDGFTAKAKFICENDSEHVDLRDATVTSVVTTEPKCETTGIRTYTATYGDYTDTKEETLATVDHNWSEWTVTKEAQVGVKGEETRTCLVGGEIETREIPALPYVPTTNEDGTKTYTETVTEEAKDVTAIFEQAKEEQGSVEIKATTEDNKEVVIVFNADAVNAIGDAEVSLSVKVVTEDMTVEDAELVLEVTLEGATFADGEAIVTLPFTQEIPAGKVAKVYYVADDGTRTDMNATFADGVATFATNHFSTYAIVLEDAPTSDSTRKGHGCFGTIGGVAASAFVVLIGITVVVLWRKRKEN
ncbi:MAG: hypothetical protein IJ800_07535, partial [Clostridia bacterium]|nr:hypothetical protein [Clostridia bacterium]